MKPDKNLEGGKRGFNQIAKQQQLQRFLLNEFQLWLRGVHRSTLLCVKLPSSVQILQLVEGLQSCLKAALLRDSFSFFFHYLLTSWQKAKCFSPPC